MATNARTVALKTVGCRLNQAEIAAMTAQFIAAGYKIVPFGCEADISVIHSCAITAKAQRDSMSLARKARRASANGTVVITGCAAEVYSKEMREKTGADLVLKKDCLTDILSHILGKHSSDYLPQNPPPHFFSSRATIKVQDGCNFFCSYCIVPKARGNPVSRPLPEIIEEIRVLANTGYREFVITGANLGLYKYANKGLINLLEEIENIPSVQRLRISSIELSTVEKDVLAFMSQSTKLCRYIHIPLQSGSDKMLKLMGRRYSVQKYRDFILSAVEQMPLLGIGTDVIAGLPGENEEAFMDTCHFLERLPFSNIHVFRYSVRQGTAAAELPNHVPVKTAVQRSKTLLTIAQNKKKVFAEKLVGKKTSCLIERIDKQGMAKGWSSEYVEIKIKDTSLRPNDIICVTPTHAKDGTLFCLSV